MKIKIILVIRNYKYTTQGQIHLYLINFGYTKQTDHIMEIPE